MKQNKYFKKGNEVFSYSFRTKKTLVYTSKTDCRDIALSYDTMVNLPETFEKISYKDFLEHFNQKPKVSRYFIPTKSYVCDSYSPYYKFLECTPNGDVIAYTFKDHFYKTCYQSEHIIYGHHLTNLTEVTKDEAFKLLEDLPVVKADTVIPEPKEEILYYDYRTGFKNPALFLSANTKTKQTYIHTRENQKGELASYSYSFEDCEHYVKCGTWKYITKEQAYDKFKTVPDKKLGLQIDSSPTPDKKIQLPEINFFILVKKGTLGTLYFKYIDPKNWTWVNNFDECTKFSTTFLHGEKFHQIKENLIDPLLEKDKQKLHWVQMAATKVQETTYEAY